MFLDMHANYICGCKYGQVHNTITLHRLIDNVSKLYPNFEICVGENHKHLKNTLIYKAKQFMLTKIISRKVMEKV